MLEHMLEPEFKRKWVAALRSGEYPQAKGRLYDGTGYCCLGVACRVLGATFVDEYEHWHPIFKDDAAPRNNEFLIPTAIATDIGLTGLMQTTLAKKNDKEGWNFGRIADFIEQSY